MTPKEKAHDLFTKFNNETLAYDSGDHTSKGINESILLMVEQNKRCAIICVDEILDGFRKVLPASRKYWEDVKEEIKKL